jgi:hypothetical protein
VPVAPLDGVEGDLEDHSRLDDAQGPVVLDGRGQEVRREHRDLGVGEPAVGLADRREPVTVANRERVIRQHARPLGEPARRGGDRLADGGKGAHGLMPVSPRA